MRNGGPCPIIPRLCVTAMAGIRLYARAGGRGEGGCGTLCRTMRLKNVMRGTEKGAERRRE
jgi:hypothetical protein